MRILELYSILIITLLLPFHWYTNNQEVIDEIKYKKYRLQKNSPNKDQSLYQKFCSDNNFLSQCSSTHYLYKKLDDSDLKENNEYMVSIYNELENLVPNIKLINNQDTTSNIRASYQQALIGDALGFLIENEHNLHEMKLHFPKGVINAKEINKSLKSGDLNTKHGKYNNNNLTHDGKILYSDNTEMSLLALYTLLSSYTVKPNDHNLITNNLTGIYSAFWHNNLKLSGKYGNDGLYYGTRGYGTKSLKSFSDIYSNGHTKNNHLSNGSLINSWVCGIMPYKSYLEAAEVAARKSFIINQSKEVAASSAALAAGIHIAIYNNPKSKMEVVNKMIDVAMQFEDLYYENTKSPDRTKYTSTYLAYAKSAAINDINPILFYNSAIGFHAPETIAAVVFCFLRHEYFLTALVESTHTPGDSDSIAHLSSALMGAYYGEKSYPKGYINYIEEPAMNLLGNKFTMKSLIDKVINIKKLR